MRSLTRTLPRDVGAHLRLGDADIRELLFDQFIAPVAEGALGELHDVPLVHQGHAAAPVLDGVLNSRAG